MVTISTCPSVAALAALSLAEDGKCAALSWRDKEEIDTHYIVYSQIEEMQ